MPGFLSLNLSTPAGIITIVVVIILLLLAFKFLGGILRVITSVILIGIILFVSYFLFFDSSVVGKAVELLPLFIFLRRKNGCF